MSKTKNKNPLLRYIFIAHFLSHVIFYKVDTYSLSSLPHVTLLSTISALIFIFLFISFLLHLGFFFSILYSIFPSAYLPTLSLELCMVLSQAFSHLSTFLG